MITGQKRLGLVSESRLEMNFEEDHVADDDLLESGGESSGDEVTDDKTD